MLYTRRAWGRLRVLLLDGRSFLSQQGHHSIACMAKAFLESIEHAFLSVVPTVVDWAGVLYEYLSIAMADMYSTELAGVITGGPGWRPQHSGTKGANTGTGSELALDLDSFRTFIPRAPPSM